MKLTANAPPEKWCLEYKPFLLGFLAYFQGLFIRLKINFGEVISLPELFGTLVGPLGDLRRSSRSEFLPPPLKVIFRRYIRANCNRITTNYLRMFSEQILGHLQPRCSMYALFTFMWPYFFWPNVDNQNQTSGKLRKIVYISTCLTSSSFPAHSPRATIFSQLVAGWIAEPLLIFKILFV